MIIRTFKIWVFFFHLSVFSQVKIDTAIHKSAKKFEKEKSIGQLSVLDYQKLIEVKKNRNTPKFSESYNELLASANKALNKPIFSVVDKIQIPPSGDKHDYLSIGPYWWPDNNKKDGLPWIRRDGEVNPLTRKSSTDFEALRLLLKNIETLSLAYFFSDKDIYALKTIEILKIWFLNEETKMNPNLNFTQGIPGKILGRQFGIIEFAGITKVITAIEILALNNTLDSGISKELRTWFTAYLFWLQTSKNGILAKNTKNNHAVWYDVQLVSILLFLNRNDEVKIVLEEVKLNRIATQINSDGKQPHELARTKSLSYSTMNLKGFTQLAFLGKKVEIDVWNYEAENGASIIKAYEFLKPFAEGKKEWNYKQISSLKNAKESLKELFVIAGSQFNSKEYCKIGTVKSKKTSLIYNCN